MPIMTNIKRLGALTAALATVLTVVAGCGSNNFRDVEGVKSRKPDKIENYNNMDGHPNVGRICIDGVAFYTTTRDFKAIERVPEWDGWCGR